MSLFVGVWVGSSGGKGQRGQRSVYLKNGVYKMGSGKDKGNRGYVTGSVATTAATTAATIAVGVRKLLNISYFAAQALYIELN